MFKCGEDIGTILAGKHDMETVNFKAICNAVDKVLWHLSIYNLDFRQKWGPKPQSPGYATDINSHFRPQRIASTVWGLVFLPQKLKRPKPFIGNQSVRLQLAWRTTGATKLISIVVQNLNWNPNHRPQSKHSNDFHNFLYLIFFP